MFCSIPHSTGSMDWTHSYRELHLSKNLAYTLQTKNHGISLTRYRLLNMCRRNTSQRDYICGHQLESFGELVPEKDCKSCGIERGKNHSIGSSVVMAPCEDCIIAGLWAQSGTGKWYKKSQGTPQQLAPGFRYPCQTSLN